MKTLFRQIQNEWRSNIFLALELLVVFVVLWYIVDWCCVPARIYFSPMGFDTEHCYKITVNRLTPNSSLYDANSTPENDIDDFLEIAERLRHRPGIENVAISQNSIPYYNGSNGFTVCVDTIPVHAMRRWIQPDFIRMFRIKGVAIQNTDGKITYTTSSDSLANVLNPNTLILSRNLTAGHKQLDMPEATPLLGKDLPINIPDNDFRMHVAAIAEPLRWSHFETSEDWGGPFIATDLPRKVMIEFENPAYLQLSVRVKPEADLNFAETLMNAADRLYQVGNVYILDVQPFSDLREAIEMEDMNEVRTQLCILGFLLLNIFLGVTGTFWFRTQHRRQEVALRLAIGSTRKNIFIRLITEGILLLLLIMIPAFCITVNIGLAELVDVSQLPFQTGRYLTAFILTILLMASMIVAGIWFPARRAMKIQPAEALHDE